jgi:hypothetical protein
LNPLELAFRLPLHYTMYTVYVEYNILEYIADLVSVLNTIGIAWHGPKRVSACVISRPIQNDIIPPISYKDVGNFNNHRCVMREVSQIALWSFGL